MLRKARKFPPISLATTSIVLLLFSAFNITICASNGSTSFSGTLLQLSSTELELRTSSDMKLSTSLASLGSMIKIAPSTTATTSISSSEQTTSSTLKITPTFTQPTSTSLRINLGISESLAFTDFILTITPESTISNSDQSKSISPSSFSMRIMFYAHPNSIEETFAEILPYIWYVLLGGILLSSIGLFVMQIDTVSIWVILDTAQLSGLLTLLPIAASPQVFSVLLYLNGSNFFFIPTYVFDLLKRLASDSIDVQSTNKFYLYANLLNAPTSTSFIAVSANALSLLLILSAITGLVSICLTHCRCFESIQKVFNPRSLYRVIDILSIHLVYSAAVAIRNNSFSKNMYDIIDLSLAVLCLAGQVYYAFVIPWKRVNTSDIIMLEHSVIEANKHFINKLRVDNFFSRNYFSIRAGFKAILAAGIGALADSDIGRETVCVFGLAYFICLISLKFRYYLYEDNRLNTIWAFSMIFLAFTFLVYSIVGGFEMFYLRVQRTSTSQFDSTYIQSNRYSCWGLIAILICSGIAFIISMITYLFSTRSFKLAFIKEKNGDVDAALPVGQGTSTATATGTTTLNAEGVAATAGQSANKDKGKKNANSQIDIELVKRNDPFTKQNVSDRPFDAISSSISINKPLQDSFSLASPNASTFSPDNSNYKKTQSTYRTGANLSNSYVPPFTPTTKKPDY